MKRGSGILLHMTSLPSRYGIGDLGPGARAFVDFLAQAKQSYWQILPLTPTEIKLANSPYSSPSAFAGNPLLISPDVLLKDRLLLPSDVKPVPIFPEKRVSYEKASCWKVKILDAAFRRYVNQNKPGTEFVKFCSDNRVWLENYAAFVVFKKHFKNKAWNKWPKELIKREPRAMSQFISENAVAIEQAKFWQYLFFKQWSDLRKYCHKKNVKIIGDIPIYVNFDSADVWTHPEIFQLDKRLNPKFVSGVPPDYFSKTGQRWGNPVYNWQKLKRQDYAWWLRRIKHNLKLYDIIRIDHFRGFVAYWRVPAHEKTAVRGRWIRVPGHEFFRKVKAAFPSIPVIAEDIGYITPAVRGLIKDLGFPGMKVLQFAFGRKKINEEHLPPNYERQCVAYTGTHDNNTLKGWFHEELTTKQKELVLGYIGDKCGENELIWELISKVMQSKADITIIPLQDLLGLGSGAKMNTPATFGGNWGWRFEKKDLTAALKRKMARLSRKFNRLSY